MTELRAAAGLSWPPPARPTLFDQAPLVSFETDRIGDSIPFNPTNFVLTGYVTMFVFFSAAMVAGAIVRERQNHTLERLLSNGVRREAVVFGKYLAAIYTGVLQVVVLWTFGILVFQVDLGLAPAAVILVSLLLVLVSAGFGVMLASIGTDRAQRRLGRCPRLIGNGPDRRMLVAPIHHAGLDAVPREAHAPRLGKHRLQQANALRGRVRRRLVGDGRAHSLRPGIPGRRNLAIPPIPLPLTARPASRTRQSSHPVCHFGETRNPEGRGSVPPVGG